MKTPTTTRPVEEYYVPWIKPLKMPVSPHIDLAWRDPSLRRMMSNENPLPPSPKVLDAIMKYATMAHRYPDQGITVRSRIAEMNGLDGPEHVVLGNGSSEVFDMVFRAFLQPDEEVIQHTPCFSIYKLRCDVLGGRLVSVPMIYRDRRLLFDAERILGAVTPKTKIIVIANPNNPTGNFMDAGDFIHIAETGIPFVIDEAYIDYAGLQKSQVHLIKTYRNVIVTRTLSKAYGLAGLRFGYLLADRDVAMRVAATLIPWNVGTIAMWAALAALEDQEGLAERVRFNNEQVAYIERTLGDVPGLIVFPSRGNYVLFDAGPAGKKGTDIVEFAQRRGIILRSEPPKYGSEGWFRVTVGTREENELFVEVIREFVSQ